MQLKNLLVVGGVLMAALACQRLHTYDIAPALEDGRDQWSATISRLGLVPVFPPREDLQAGDIYAFSFNPEATGKDTESADNGYGLHPSRWMQVKNINQLLKDEYQTRPAWRETPGAAGLSPGYGSDVTDDAGHPRRLRIVAFPDFVGATLRDSSSLMSRTMVHNGIIPAEVFDLNEDPIARKVSMVSLKLPSAESYALSQSELLHELIDQSGPKKVLKSPYLESSRWQAHQGRLWLRVVAEVYTIRNMDISVEYATKPRKASTDGYAMTAPNPTLKVKERVKALNDSLQAIGAQNLPGGTLKYINSSDNRVALRRTWERGICIGFRGFTLEIDPQTGEVLHLHPLNPFNRAARPRVL